MLKTTKIKRIIFYWLPFILYSLLIIYLSQQPHIDFGPIKPSDKVLHFLEYAGYAWLLIRLLILYQVANFYQLTLGISTLYGISDEFHQYFVPGRDCSVMDMAVDFIGALTVVLLYKIISPQINKK